MIRLLTPSHRMRGWNGNEGILAGVGIHSGMNKSLDPDDEATKLQTVTVVAASQRRTTWVHLV